MKKNIALALLLSLCCLSLLACTPRSQQPQTFDEQQALAAKEQCSRDASSMNDGPHNSSNALWRSYFEMCMKRLGVTQEEMKKLWY